jgi:hypothetical protein
MYIFNIFPVPFDFRAFEVQDEKLSPKNIMIA